MTKTYEHTLIDVLASEEESKDTGQLLTFSWILYLDIFCIYDNEWSRYHVHHSVPGRHLYTNWCAMKKNIVEAGYVNYKTWNKKYQVSFQY